MANDFKKDPDAVLDWYFDWSRWLSSGEVISSSIFIASAGIAIGTTSNNPTNTTVWLSGGENGQTYQVTNRIVTNLGRTDDRSINIRITDR